MSLLSKNVVSRFIKKKNVYEDDRSSWPSLDKLGCMKKLSKNFVRTPSDLYIFEQMKEFWRKNMSKTMKISKQ